MTPPREVGFGTMVVATICGGMAALCAIAVLAGLDVGSDYIPNVLFATTKPFLWLLAGSAVVVGVAAWSARTHPAAAVRGCVAALAVLLLVLGWIALRTGPLEPQFDAAAFRAAMGDMDGEGNELDIQARRALQQNALDGMSRAELYATLGPPDDPEARRWKWGLGTLNVGFDERGRPGRVRYMDLISGGID